MMSARSWDLGGNRNRLYGRRWREARKQFLMRNPCCKMCASVGKTVAANVVDHIVPHKGDETLFWDRSNWQPLCTHHHNSHKAIEELRGYSAVLDGDGWPLDPNHPSNTGVQPISGKSRPEGLQKISVPVVMVCGPPASGKTSFCKDRMGSDDILIDFDEIDARINRVSRRRNKLLVPILRERNRMLLEAATKEQGRVFFPLTISTQQSLDWWIAQLGPLVAVAMATDAETCLERIIADPAREAEHEQQTEQVHRWWRTFDFEPDAIVTADGGHFNHEINAHGHQRSQKRIDLVLEALEKRKGAETVQIEQSDEPENRSFVL